MIDASDASSEVRGATAPREGLWALARRAAGAVRWYVTTLMGDRAYDTYVAHLQAQHPDAEPLTERQFWRQRMDEQDCNPGARCC